MPPPPEFSPFPLPAALPFPRLFLGLPPHAAMAVNLDDPFGTRLLSPSRTRVVTYGRATRADVLPLELATTIDGLRLKLRTPKGDVVVVSALLGRTNVANIMAAMAAACALDLNLEDAAAGIHEVKSIPGRAEHDLACARLLRDQDPEGDRHQGGEKNGDQGQAEVFEEKPEGLSRPLRQQPAEPRPSSG